jgi:sugar phosphate isomerase/epimerase
MSRFNISQLLLYLLPICYIIDRKHAVFVHAKLYDIGYKKDCGCCPPCLDEKTLDFERIIDIFIKVGYSGYMSIEYEGREDPVTAVPKCVKVLRQYI